MIAPLMLASTYGYERLESEAVPPLEAVICWHGFERSHPRSSNFRKWFVPGAAMLCIVLSVGGLVAVMSHQAGLRSQPQDFNMSGARPSDEQPAIAELLQAHRDAVARLRNP
jgi:hypothetical protein